MPHVNSVPITKSALKAMRQSARRRAVNLRTKDKYKKALSKFRKLIAAGNPDKAKAAMTAATSAIDKAAKKHIVHKNKADRLKSRMARAFAKISSIIT